MGTHDIRKLRPIPQGQEDRLLCALMDSSPEFEHFDDSPELVEAFFGLGMIPAAEREPEAEKAPASSGLHRQDTIP